MNRSELEREIHLAVAGDRHGRISEDRLRAALAMCRLIHLPLNSRQGDVIAIPTPDEQVHRVEMRDSADGKGLPKIFADMGTPGLKAIALQFAEGAWKSIAEGEYTVPDVEPPTHEQHGTEHVSVIRCGGERIAVDSINGEPGRNLITSLENDWGMELENARVRILDIQATRHHLLLTVTTKIRDGKPEMPADLPWLMIEGRDSKHRHDVTHQIIEDFNSHAGWEWKTDAKAFGSLADERAVAFQLWRRDRETHVVVDQQFVILSDRQIPAVIVPLRGAFETLQLANGKLWTWRPTAGGIVLTRYELSSENA